MALVASATLASCVTVAVQDFVVETELALVYPLLSAAVNEAVRVMVAVLASPVVLLRLDIVTFNDAALLDVSVAYDWLDDHE